MSVFHVVTSPAVSPMSSRSCGWTWAGSSAVTKSPLADSMYHSLSGVLHLGWTMASFSIPSLLRPTLSPWHPCHATPSPQPGPSLHLSVVLGQLVRTVIVDPTREPASFLEGLHGKPFCSDLTLVLNIICWSENETWDREHPVMRETDLWMKSSSTAAEMLRIQNNH